MGFEPFSIPKRTERQIEPVSRDEKVSALAKLLHERGLTSSMTDAKRLAEGMVEVEKKVMKQSPKPEEQHAARTRLEMGTNVPQKQSFGLKLNDEFSRFVSQAAIIPHEGPVQQVEIPLHPQMRFGRDAESAVAEVPHIQARKQVFFEDAPDITKARGYNGPKAQAVEFPTQSRQTEPQSALRVETGDVGVKVTRAEATPTVEIVQKEMIIEDTPIVPSPSRSMPTAAELLEEELKDNPEKTTELPKEKPRETEDLAKKHGVDIFSMFKTNK